MNKRLIIRIIFIVIICALLVLKFSDNFSSVFASHTTKKVAAAKITPTKNPVPTPTTPPAPTSKPTYAPVFQSVPTTAPTAVNYQNYGWYTHDGQTMQYLNGNWYNTAQQNATPTPVPNRACPQNVPDDWCEANCQNKTPDECSSKYKSAVNQ